MPHMTITRLSLFVLVLLSAGRLLAAGVVDSIAVDDRRNPATVRIEFTVPLQYVTHAPEHRGDELQIQLRAVSGNVFSRQAFANEHQTVTANRDSLVPLIEARYEPLDAECGTLTLRFSRKVEYRVYPGSDHRHLRVEVTTTRNILKAPGRPAKKLRPGEASALEPDINYTEHYVINLESSLGDLDRPPAESLGLGPGILLYTAQFPIDGRVWTRLRAGFFATRRRAKTALKKIRRRYPGAWIDYASAREIRAARQQAGKPETVDRRARPDIIPTLPRVPDEKIAELMEQARKAMANNDIGHAIQLYTKVLRYPDNPYRRDALEFLGVARERKGQIAHAVREYRRYLALYPEGEGARRVAQRLAGITTARQAPPKAAPGRRRARGDSAWERYGSLSQFYRRDESTTDAAGQLITQSSLSTDLDVTARRRGGNQDILTRFTGSYLHDFLADGSGDQSSVSSLYADISDRGHRLSARIGRQSRNTGGVLGRFDGLLAGYRPAERVLLNAVAGFPVLSSRDNPDTGRLLYGVSADLGTFANAWDFNLFYIEQQNDGLLDRRAVGGEARYFDPQRSLLGFVDYDVSYDSLNTLILLGTWTLADHTVINANIDYRNSPILTTGNALQGQAVSDLDALGKLFSESEIRSLAEDRTGRATSATLGASRPLSEKLQLSGDLTVSKIEGTNASGGVDAVAGSDTEFFGNLQWIGSNLLVSGDVTVFGLRYADTTSNHTASLSLNSRFPFRTVWRFNPRMRIDYRDNIGSNSTQWIAAPSMRIDYRWRRRYRFETEFGGEWSTEELPNDTRDSSSFYFNLGYRADF